MTHLPDAGEEVTGTIDQQRKPKLWMLVITVWLITAAFLSLMSWQYNQTKALDNLDTQAVKLSVSLEAHLAQFRSLPKMVSHVAEVKRLLYLSSERQVEATNRTLVQLNQELGSDVIYILDAKGTTLASSNYAQSDSFVGDNYDFRPYYTKAMLGRSASYHAFGIASGKLGYYFSTPVYGMLKDEILGVVVLKINLDFVDSLLSLPDHDFILSDDNGIIFLASKISWMYRTLPDTTKQTRQAVAQSRQYGDMVLGGALYARLTQTTGTVCDLAESRCLDYLQVNKPLSIDQWGVHLLMPLRTLYLESIYFLILYSALFWLLVLSFQFYRHQRQYQQYLADEKNRLESRVGLLTADLRATNKNLLASVSHHRSAKEALEEAQSELIQAEKMALLGELSVGLHHELNQPILAIKAYAENGRLFLQRNNIDSAIGNLTEIDKITDTVAAIISQFKVFSRKEVQSEITHMEDILAGALLIMKPKLKRQNVRVNQTMLEQKSPVILASIVQLQQVVVNLIANAIQAMEHTVSPQLDLRIRHTQDVVMLEVEDNGPGLGVVAAEKIFTPFFTTKPQGLGLGLSLSKRIIELHHGKISTDGSASGGTIFRIELPIMK